jgi:hypothetical protein
VIGEISNYQFREVLFFNRFSLNDLSISDKIYFHKNMPAGATTVGEESSKGTHHPVFCKFA